jgi:guanylate kinase
LRQRHPELRWSVSWATRPRRAGEIDGVDYHFVSRDQFEALRDAGGFLEWFDVYGDLKGTPREFVVDALAAGADVMVEVDVQGALAIRAQIPSALLVFVQAPSRAEQRRRLEARGSETQESLERRLEQAAAEEDLARSAFDAIVVNHDIGEAADEVAAILTTRRAAGS